MQRTAARISAADRRFASVLPLAPHRPAGRLHASAGAEDRGGPGRLQPLPARPRSWPRSCSSASRASSSTRSSATAASPATTSLPEQLHGNNTVEIIWTLIPTVIVFILFGFSMVTLGGRRGALRGAGRRPSRSTASSGMDLPLRERRQSSDRQRGEPAGPRRAGRRAGAARPELARRQPRLLRAGVPASSATSSTSAEHGRAERAEFTVTEAGTYAGQCAEFCGTAHADMIFVVRGDAARRVRRLHRGARGRARRRRRPATATVHDHHRDHGGRDIQFDTDAIRGRRPGRTSASSSTNNDNVPHDVGIYEAASLSTATTSTSPASPSRTTSRPCTAGDYTVHLHPPSPGDGRRPDGHASSTGARAKPWQPPPSNRRPAPLSALLGDRLADHGRPQEDRDPVHRQQLPVLLRRRDPGARHPQRAGRAGPPVPRPGHVQPGLHDARDDHAVPVHHPGAVGLRELHRAAPARRAGHGLPAHQRPQLLAAAARRPPHLQRLPLRRRGRRGLDRLRAADERPLLAGRGDRPVDHRPDSGRHCLDPGRGELHRHHLQDARARA